MLVRRETELILATNVDPGLGCTPRPQKGSAASRTSDPEYAATTVRVKTATRESPAPPCMNRFHPAFHPRRRPSCVDSVAYMSAPPAEPDDGNAAEPTPATPPWTSLQKLGFRLLLTVGGGLLIVSIYGNAALAFVLVPVYRALAQLGSLVARGRGIHFQASNVGDTKAIWCVHLGWIVVAVALTVGWTALDRRRNDYRALAGLLFVFARFGLAVSMIVYGIAKTVPTQMGFMALPTYQLQLTGDTSLMGTLWGFMGASTPYSIATGLVELSAGLLLLWRRTWLLGAIVAIVATTQVFLLNLLYDVPVKLVSGELLLVAVGLTTPYWRALARVVFDLGPGEQVRMWPPAGSRRPRVRGAAIALKWVIAAFYLVGLTWVGIWSVVGMHSRHSAIDGVWRATSFTVDGAEATLQQTSPAPWVNIAITDRGARFSGMTSQIPTGYVTAWSLRVDGGRLEIRKRASDPMTVLDYRLDGNDRLVLTGTLHGHRVEGHYERRLMERSRSGFHLIQPDMEAPDRAAQE